MAKLPNVFKLLDDWLHDKEKILNRRKAFWLANSTFKGIGQILFCGSPLSGLLFLAALASGWWVIAPYCLAGSAVATLTAFALRQKAAVIGAGVFGYNGALIGLTWPFFWPLSYFSPPLLILASGLSTLFAIPLRNFMSDSRLNLPIVSIPFVVIFLIFLVSADASGLLPWYSLKSPPPSLHSLDTAGIYKRAFHAEEWYIFGQQLLCYSVPVGIFFVGILVYSRISALLAFVGGSLSFTTAFLIMGQEGISQLGLHGFTSVPIAVALGGFFIVFNISSFFYSLFATCLGIFLWFLISPIFAPHGVPVLTSIFNVVTLLFLLPLKQPSIATKVSWLFAVGLNHVARPEDTLRWHKLHKDAARYWKSIK